MAAPSMKVSPLNDLLSSEGVQMHPLFGASEDSIIKEAVMIAPSAPIKVPDLSVFYKIESPEEKIDKLCESLLDQDVVEAAYVKPPIELPDHMSPMVPSAVAPPAITPDFTGRQGYLDASPGGIDARHAWTIAGGKGAGIKIVDLEHGWQFSHEDLQVNSLGLLDGINSTSTNHGTAVIGEIGGDENGFGITGIAPEDKVGGVSWSSMSASTAIRTAADSVNSGDIILLEGHMAGPRHNFQLRPDQKGYIAIEWWSDMFAAIQYAISRGVIVIEAAGNGAEDLDDSLYDIRPSGFPSSWVNPFNTSNPSSRAVFVGAGAPPPGTHGRNSGPDRSRLDFSNYGSRIDVQGWGREVTSAGYGDLQGVTQDRWYTDNFGGTSSASPIVTGAVACLQGIKKARGEPLLTFTEVINILRTTGSPQQNHPSRPVTQRIGNRPDLKEAIDSLVGISSTIDAPRNFKGKGLDTSRIELSWIKPVNTGGVSIANYEIKRKETGTSGWFTLPNSLSGTSTGVIDTGLDKDTSYDYEITAINSVGTSVSSTSARTKKCFILTATYGSELEARAYYVHEFIDDVLLKSRFQKLFRDFLTLYFKFSPPIANLMDRNKAFKYLIKYSVAIPFLAITRITATLVNFFIKH